MKPPIFFVSSQLAQKAKFSGSALEADALLGASGFAELERYVTDLLDEEGRVRLKLESPLGVVEELVRRYRLAVEERVSLLEDDFKMAENVESQLEAYKEDMKRDFEARMAEIENIILSMNERGDEWFEENIRLANVRELVQREKVQDRFQREVVANTEGLIDERVEELIDWMVDRNLKQWRAVIPVTSTAADRLGTTSKSSGRSATTSSTTARNSSTPSARTPLTSSSATTANTSRSSSPSPCRAPSPRRPRSRSALLVSGRHSWRSPQRRRRT